MARVALVCMMCVLLAGSASAGLSDESSAFGLYGWDESGLVRSAMGQVVLGGDFAHISASPEGGFTISDDLIPLPVQHVIGETLGEPTGLSFRHAVVVRQMDPTTLASALRIPGFRSSRYRRSRRPAASGVPIRWVTGERVVPRRSHSQGYRRTGSGASVRRSRAYRHRSVAIPRTCLRSRYGAGSRHPRSFQGSTVTSVSGGGGGHAVPGAATAEQAVGGHSGPWDAEKVPVSPILIPSTIVLGLIVLSILGDRRRKRVGI